MKKSKGSKAPGIIFLLILLLGGAAFFFGWVQLSVPIGSYGVMRSKTHGLDPQIIQAGDFRWVWYKLIPTNVSIEVFTIDNNISRTFRVQGILPSGADYAAFAGFETDFSFELNGVFSFNIRPQSLISLLEDRRILDQRDLVEFERQLVNDMQSFILQRLHLHMNNADMVKEMVLSGRLAPLEQEVAEEFPFIENFSCRINSSRFPDFELYYQFRAMYNDYVARIRDFMRSNAMFMPEARVRSFMRLDELARYGELLSRFPILLDFLTLESQLP